MPLPVISVSIGTIWTELSPDQVSLLAAWSTNAERAQTVHAAPAQVAQGQGAGAEANRPLCLRGPEGSLGAKTE